MTWLDIGNGWRNLYLLSCAVQMGALGALFAWRRWFCGHSRAACFLTGVATTPLAQYLWALLLALVYPRAPRLVYIGALPALGALGLLALALRYARRAPELLRRGWALARRVCRFDKPALIALCFALCVVILIGPVCVRYLSSMESARGGDTGEYLALAQRYCEDRSLFNLLEKEETVGHFRGHSHFPSLELYMSYGLFHTGGEVGYPYDKPVFTAMGLLIFYVAAAYVALLLCFCRERKRWVLLGVVLFNLVPELFYSVESAPRDIWRMVALLWGMLVYAGMRPPRGWKRYVGMLAWSFAVCFTVMSAHVVCFVVLPFIVAAWVIWRFADVGMRELRGAGGELLRAVGVALAGAAGTLAGFSGNLWCFWRWGELSPGRLMNTFTDAPWYDLYMAREFKLEETTTHLNFFTAKDSILQSYATYIGDWGLYLGLAALVGAGIYCLLSRRRMRATAKRMLADQPRDGVVGVIVRNGGAGADEASGLLLIALYTLLTLAPMTGVLDSPLYSFSGSFLKLPRYTLQWFLCANVTTCAALSSLEGLWPLLCGRLATRAGRTSARLAALRPYVRRAPAYLCALMCVMGVVDGTKQTGYANTFYRYSRGVMESESILLDNGFRERYQLLMDVAAHVDDSQRILITRAGYQYPLRARGYVLSANPIVPLMNLPLDEVGGALAEMNVAMLATEPDFWDERYFALSTLSEYLNALPPERIVETEKMRLYLLDESLIPWAREALNRERGEE